MRAKDGLHRRPDLWCWRERLHHGDYMTWHIILWASLSSTACSSQCDKVRFNMDKQRDRPRQSLGLLHPFRGCIVCAHAPPNDIFNEGIEGIWLVSSLYLFLWNVCFVMETSPRSAGMSFFRLMSPKQATLKRNGLKGSVPATASRLRCQDKNRVLLAAVTHTHKHFFYWLRRRSGVLLHWRHGSWLMCKWTRSLSSPSGTDDELVWWFLPEMSVIKPIFLPVSSALTWRNVAILSLSCTHTYAKENVASIFPYSFKFESIRYSSLSLCLCEW